jgi:ribonuclease P protein component
MLPKKRRISRKEFGHLFLNGKRFNSSAFLMNLVTKDKAFSSNDTRFSFSVSKKVSNSAVLRNKLRRRGYSVVEKNIEKIKTGFLISFSFKKGAEKYSFDQTEKEIVDLLSKASVLE